MEMVPLYSKFPKIAQAETRAITLLENPHGLEKGEYGFIELFCTDKTCDCRRVMVQVYGPGGKFYATLSYGWENLDFYTAWMFGDDRVSHEMVGAQLYSLAPQTKDSELFLNYFKELLEDKTYADRIKQHYRLFKKAKKAKPVYFSNEFKPSQQRL